jgi:hypothetical protein
LLLFQAREIFSVLAIGHPRGDSGKLGDIQGNSENIQEMGGSILRSEMGDVREIQGDP